ncbi:MAG: 50S ribosomal protein L18 [bacterium]|nr:50S ribosomal protein L18 [bacterium]
MKVRNVHKRKRAMKTRRHARVRAKVFGFAERPRLSVFRSAKHIRVQLIDDQSGRTLGASSDKDVTVTKGSGKIAIAEAVGKAIAEKAKTAGITKVVFDRGSFAYHGRVKAVAEGARSGGLVF